jgi:phosphate transport system substrate-binding protein
MKRIVLVLASLVMMAGLVFAGGQTEDESLHGVIRIAGSSTVYPISVAVAEEFSRVHPDVEIPIQSTGTGGGFKNFFLPGKTDINDASRAIKDSEIEKARENGIEPIELRVGIDAITIVVNKDADWLDDITPEQLSMIWRPDNPARKWSEVDPSWPDEEIELFGPTAASGTFDFFTDVINGEEGASRSDYQGTEQDNTIVNAVSGQKYAMGYFGMAYYLENKDKLKAVSVNGVLPGIETAKSGEYLLSRPLFIYVSDVSLERLEVRTFVEFFIKLTSTDLISEIGYVPLTEEDMEANLEKLKSYIQ